MRAAGPRHASFETLCVVLLSFLCGCSHSLVRDGAVRPDLYAELVERTGETRGITPERVVPAEVIASAEIPDLIHAAVATHWDPGSLDAYEDSLVTLGLWPRDRDLVAEHVAVGLEEFSGLYLPSRRTLYLVDDLPIPFLARLVSWLTRNDLYRKLILSHEIVHALQHEAYPWLLEEGLAWEQQDDAAMAIRVALEGDASVYGLRAVWPGEIPRPATVREGMNQQLEEDDALARAPALVRYAVLLPYAEGYGLSYVEGPALLENPPVSTEQLLHPRMRNAEFSVFDLRGATALLPAHCRLRAENTLGEFGISVLLRDLSGEVSSAAWEGWDGDRYLTARCDGRREFVWITTWDSWADADQFAKAYTEVAEAIRARAELTEAPRIVRDGLEVRIASEALWERSGEIVDAARRAQVSNLEELRNHYQRLEEREVSLVDLLENLAQSPLDVIDLVLAQPKLEQRTLTPHAFVRIQGRARLDLDVELVSSLELGHDRELFEILSGQHAQCVHVAAQELGDVHVSPVAEQPLKRRDVARKRDSVVDGKDPWSLGIGGCQEVRRAAVPVVDQDRQDVERGQMLAVHGVVLGA